ncbi:MAG: hypothetical protein P4L44_06355 [Oryzomonas sp.]|uniref:hypothetical protein n=1 Tax=Oryzomonas sp. TaxID=2855186 RepID=UPI00284AF5FE|nr:hypothetical protein [Oryzomonas sp.]MDR3579564.1 hypothetical protein [Oryzomonas sp.]
MSEISVPKIKAFISMALNRTAKVRDTIYLDTNAWSMLAKGLRPIVPLAKWVAERGYFVWMARMQLAEISARRDILVGLADVLEHLPVVFLDHDQSEYDGGYWWDVGISNFEYLNLTTPDLKSVFVSEMWDQLASVREQLKSDGVNFWSWLKLGIAAIPPEGPQGWARFTKSVESRIRFLAGSRLSDEEWLKDPDRFIGIRLAHSVLFARYVVTNSKWQGTNDYLDYLHASDMAYAKVVLTERNLANCLRQARSRLKLIAPDLIVETNWLVNPVDYEL